MAGNYVDVPSWRIPYDRDGTVLLEIVAGLPTQRSQADLQTLNNESSDSLTHGGYSVATGYWCLIFPRLMDIDGLYIGGHVGGTGATAGPFEYSTNTTNGIDGTWTPYAGGWWVDSGSPIATYRTSIQSGTLGGIRGIRWYLAGGYGGSAAEYCHSAHLYGEPTAGQDANRLEFWHATSAARLAPAALDWGNVPRSSTEDRQFRVKNLSSTLTANSVRVSFEALTDTTPTVPGQYTVSTDGVNFFAQRTISSIAPGALSSVMTVRRVTPSNAVLSLWALRMNAEATGGWS